MIVPTFSRMHGAGHDLAGMLHQIFEQRNSRGCKVSSSCRAPRRWESRWRARGRRPCRRSLPPARHGGATAPRPAPGSSRRNRVLADNRRRRRGRPLMRSSTCRAPRGSAPARALPFSRSVPSATARHAWAGMRRPPARRNRRHRERGPPRRRWRDRRHDDLAERLDEIVGRYRGRLPTIRKAHAGIQLGLTDDVTGFGALSPWRD